MYIIIDGRGDQSNQLRRLTICRLLPRIGDDKYAIIAR